MTAIPVLHSFWLSSCSWRVRAALRLKNVEFEERPVDIVKEKKQLTDEYRAVNPSRKVPALFIDGHTIVESMAILQYLEDTRPEPSLVPKSPLSKARMLEICEKIVSGIQPLQNVGMRSQFESEERFQQFAQHNTEKGLQSLEVLLKNSSGRYCIEDQLTLADLCLVPQMYNSETRLQIDITKYPILNKLYKNLLNEKVFQETHPKAVKPKST